MRNILFTFALLWLTIPITLAQRTPAGVAKAVEQLRLALIDPTETKLAALVADSLNYGHSSGKVEDKAEFMRALLSGDSDFKTINLSEQRITLVDNVALVRHVLQAETLNGGKPGTANLSVLLVWTYQREGRAAYRWKLLARQAVKR